MKLSNTQDIGAPIEFVFAQITDFKAIERAAMRRGADVQRVDELTKVAPGMAWDTSFRLRGRQRDMRLELQEIDEPNRLVLSATSPSIKGRMVVELLALSRAQTRVTMETVLDPKNLSAKLLIQSMKLARKNIDRRLKKRLGVYADEVENRYKRLA